ncbi:MAG TPA: hypothetical protein VKX17_08055, partial [Planctomycetota bacterium]|nr:hypothetical protein [Planctomycetota bacterium]
STQTPHDTGEPLSFSPGMVASFKLKNGTGPKVEESIKKIQTVVNVLLAQQKIPAVFAKVKNAAYKGTTIYYYNALVSLNGSLVLAVVKDQLIYGDSLNAVKRSLDQLGSGTNILSNKSFQTALARVSGQPFDAAKLPLSFAWSEDYGGGGGVFVLALAGVATGTAVVSGISEVANMGRPLPPEPGAPNPFDEITRHAGGRAAVKVLDGLDLNLWPEEDFFIKHRQSHASFGMKTERGWFSRSEFPPPMPRYGNISPMLIVAGVAMIAAVAMPAFARARSVAQVAVINNNLRQIHMAIATYELDNGTIPRDLADLYPKYVDDVRVFQNPTHPGEDAAYTYMSGVLSSDAGAILAYENNADQGFRNVLKTDGSVIRVGEEEFTQMIKATEDAARKLGRTVKPTPVSMKEISKKKKE